MHFVFCCESNIGLELRSFRHLFPSLIFLVSKSLAASREFLSFESLASLDGNQSPFPYVQGSSMNDIKEIKRLPSPVPMPQALAWDGSLLWMGSLDTKKVYQVDPEN